MSDDPVIAAMNKLEPKEQELLQNHWSQQGQLNEQSQKRKLHLQDQLPHYWTRICLLWSLQNLQYQRGGHFEQNVVFVHCGPGSSERVFSVKRIGIVQLWDLWVGLEVYDHGSIQAGNAIIPIDSIAWIGVTDAPINSESLGFGKDPTKSPPPQPSDIRELIGLPIPMQPSQTEPPTPTGSQ